MVVWLNAAPRMQAGARSPEEEKTALKKAVSGPTLPLCYRELNGCWSRLFLGFVIIGNHANVWTRRTRFIQFNRNVCNSVTLCAVQ